MSSDETDNDDSFSTQLYIPTFNNDLNKIFCYFGRIKWLIIDKKKCLTTETSENLRKEGWTIMMGGVYESPIITSFQEHSILIKKTIDILRNESDENIEIIPSYGCFPSINFKK